MKTFSTFMIPILLAFILAACGTNATETEDGTLSNAYTAAASTLAVQSSFTTPTISITVLATVTPFSFPTIMPVTVTTQNQSVVSYSSASTANGCNNSIYVSDVTVADGTILAPGESFTKTWEFQNTGTCDWSEDDLLTFVSGNDMDGESAAIDTAVGIGEAADLSVSLVAPSTEGSYTGYWRLADENGNMFGQSVYVMIVVSDDASTTTPTPTSTTGAESTSTSAPTSTPTSVPTSTSTSLPSAVPTETSTPVPTSES